MQKTDFKRFGLMMDMSRNSVMNLPQLKVFTKEIASMGYNMLMLYTEDTYEIPEEPYFGHFRGRYTHAELKELVAHCEGLGIEVIPCIQTLAHLGAIFRWPRFQRIQDCNDILLAETEETYEFIESMFRTVKECFTSKVVHIGMDEAHMVGLGKYLEKFGFDNRFQILSRHLKKVCEIAKKYDLEPLMWGDMFFRLGNGGLYYNVENPKVPDPEELKLPKEIEITYWDYYYSDVPHYEKMIRAHRKLKQPLWFAGGIWSWKGFAPDNQFSYIATKAALTACRNEKVENVFLTLWGDNGGECLRWSTLSAIYAAARLAQGETDEALIKKEFEEKYGIAYDEFNLLDMHEPVLQENRDYKTITNPEKYLLFNDPFLGVCDSTLNDGENAYYADLAQKMDAYCNHPQFGWIFRSQRALAATLSHKAQLGKMTRAAYQKKDRGEIRRLLGEYDATLAELERFTAAYRAAWMKENKPHGLEVQEIRLGGLRCRLESCRERLLLWLEEGVEIPELEEKALDLQGKGETMGQTHLRYPRWGMSTTVNTLDTK